MAFQQEQPIIPTAIGDFSVQLVDRASPEPDQPAQTALFEIQVLDADGNIMRLMRGNLAPHITTAQRQALMSFMSDLRVQAEQQILWALLESIRDAHRAGETEL